MTPEGALQAVLAGEHAAIYVYGVLGAQASQSRQPRLYDDLTQSYLVHRKRRDHLTAVIVALHGDPVASEPAYQLPNPASTAAQLVSAARTVEQRMATLYGQLVENSVEEQRRWAISALDECARRVLLFHASPTDFPGLSTPPS